MTGILTRDGMGWDGTGWNQAKSVEVKEEELEAGRVDRISLVNIMSGRVRWSSVVVRETDREREGGRGRWNVRSGNDKYGRGGDGRVAVCWWFCSGGVLVMVWQWWWWCDSGGVGGGVLVVVVW